MIGIKLVTLLFLLRYGSDVTKKTWREVNEAFSGLNVENVLLLGDLLLSLSPTSVANERCFSQLKLIKTDKRQRVKQQRLNNIMLVKLEAENEEDFDPNPAINHWMVHTTT